MSKVPVLEVRDLQVAFGSSNILRGVSFDLNAGETLGVARASCAGTVYWGVADPGRGC